MALFHPQAPIQKVQYHQQGYKQCVQHTYNGTYSPETIEKGSIGIHVPCINITNSPHFKWKTGSKVRQSCSEVVCKGLVGECLTSQALSFCCWTAWRGMSAWYSSSACFFFNFISSTSFRSCRLPSTLPSAPATDRQTDREVRRGYATANGT